MKMTERNPGGTPLWRSPFGMGLLVVLGIAFFFLWTEHRAHLLGSLPLVLLLLLCPLVHLFMHHGHRHSPQDNPDTGESNPDQGGRT